MSYLRGIDPEPAQGALRDFRSTWPQLLLLSLATRLAVALALLPALALVLRLVLGIRGHAALSDEEILHFLLTPLGIATLLVVGGAWLGVAVAELAGLTVIGAAAARGIRIDWRAALRHLAARAWRIVGLARRILLRTLGFALPALLLVWVAYRVLLGDHDINYYLARRPPELFVAMGFAAAVGGGLVVLLVPRALAWLLALPTVLLEDAGPAEALRRAAVRARGRRSALLTWIGVWLAAGWLASVSLTWALGVAGRLIVPAASDSVRLVALGIAAVGVAAIGLNLALSFLSAALFALLLARVYSWPADEAPLPVTLAAKAARPARSRRRIPRAIRIAAAGIVAVGVLLVSHALVSGVRTGDHTLVIGHRGAPAHAPENTLAAVRRAIDDGADLVEIDVQETADGEVVVFHDSDFMKTAGSPLRLWDARRADLDTLDVGGWFDPAFSGERVATLEQVLQAARGRAGVAIELKYYGHDQELERKVVEEVERTEMESDVVVMLLKLDKVHKIRRLRPDWTYGLLTSVNLGDATRFDVDFLAVNASAATRGFVRRAHAAGRQVYAWTVNDPFTMSAMMSRGVDGIITDDPGLARKVLEARAGLSAAERLLVGVGTEIGALALPGPALGADDA